jgi:hypothetical protein
MQRQLVDLKSRRCETIPCDLECSERFPVENTSRKVLTNKEEIKGKKFIEIDMLVLSTYYAKNMDRQHIEKVGGQDTTKK